MLELTGINLPQRQQELNKLVNEAILNKVNFNDIQSLEEHSDVDRLYKIDVASKYKNSEYIIETLKCGDSLYISRALKCEWLYNDDFSHIINTDYLHHNIFPWMSIKMKKKMLTTISCHVRNEDRMLHFYNYCKAIKLNDIAFKFLIFTSEIHKLDYLQNINEIDKHDLQNFFGNSFKLVEAYLGKLRGIQIYTNDKIIKFSYLYAVSNENYLNLLERYSVEHNNGQRLGLRLSKNILIKNKERVVQDPTLYIKYLNMNMIAKYSTIEEAKQYIIAVLPCDARCFWSMNFYESYRKIFDLLPANEIYHFLRQIFLDKYGNEQFEMCKNFYDLQYYKLLTIEERELWALKHLEQKKELLGAGEDFLWYKFVNFDVSFKEIKKYIYKTGDYYKRRKIINVLIHSIRNEQQLESLINYYYERHVNEIEYIKQDFIDDLIELQNVFKYNEPCWNAFNKILHSMKNFSADNMDSTKSCAIIYYIIHDREMPKNLRINEIRGYTITNYFSSYFKYLTEEQIKLIYEYFINLFSNLMKEFDNKDYNNEENKAKICKYIDSAIEVLLYFNKTKHDCPDIIYKYVKLYWDTYKDSNLFAEEEQQQEHTQGSLIRLLKQDTNLLLKTLPGVIDSFTSRWNFIPLNNLMKKLRIYFLNDIAKKIVKLFETCLLKESLSNERYVVFSAVNGIFHVANDSYKIDFMTKYAPTDSKISHDTIDQNILTIQESICRFAYYSRPPIPLPLVLQFIKGDYLRFCLPMLSALVANLPKTLSLQFITGILDAPVSVQKHGLRLAFHHFNTEDLKQLIVNAWKKTKNVSLRKILYTSLVDYIVSLDEHLQQSFYEVLKFFTTNLNEDDDDDIFKCHYLPTSIKGDFLETAWKTIKTFPDENSNNVERKIYIISEIEDYIYCVNKEFCRIHILDELVDYTLFKENVEMSDKHDAKTRLIYQKWKLAAKYINYFDCDKEMERSMEFVSIIIKRCIEMGEEYYIKFTMFQFLNTFLEDVLNSSRIFDNDYDKATEVVPMLEYIINLLLELMPMSKIYLLYWNYSLMIILIKVVGPKMVQPITGEKGYDHLNANEIATRFTNELLLFMNCLKEKNILYISCFETIAVLIYDISGIAHRIRIHLALSIIDRLTDIQTHETFLLAMMLFKKQFPSGQYCPNLEKIYNKVMEFDNEEVKTIMYKNILSESKQYF